MNRGTLSLKVRSLARFLVLGVALAPFVVLLPTPELYAANSALDGAWRMDLERSDAMMRGIKVDNSYTLAAKGENVEVKRTFYRDGQSNAIDWVFVTDGKPHEVPGMRAPRKVRVKWKKEKLNVSYSMSFETPRGEFSVDVTETWLINKAGELEIRYVTRTAGGPQNRVEVYTREAAS